MEIFDYISGNDNFILSAIDQWDGERKVIESSCKSEYLKNRIQLIKTSFEYNNYYGWSIFKIEKTPQKKQP